MNVRRAAGVPDAPTHASLLAARAAQATDTPSADAGQMGGVETGVPRAPKTDDVTGTRAEDR